MEIDITSFFNNEDPSDYSASQAELGENAGKITWRAAVEQGSGSPLLTTPDEIEALREYVKDFGAWDEEEIAGWSDAECNALFIQLVSGDMREIESLCMGDDGEVQWPVYEMLAEKGTISGNIYKGDDGRIYYYLGS